MCIRFSASSRKSLRLSTDRADGGWVGKPSSQRGPAGFAGECGYLHVENGCPFDFSRQKSSRLASSLLYILCIATHITEMANDVAAVFEPRASTGVSPTTSLGTLRSCGLQLCSALRGLSLALLCSDDEIPRLSMERRSNITQRLRER
jgi:hypothetical protein